MPKKSNIIGRNTEAQGTNPRESHITAGGIETNVHAFFGGITNPVASVEFTYGEHKRPGSEMAPVVKGGRGGAKAEFHSKLNSGGN